MKFISLLLGASFISIPAFSCTIGKTHAEQYEYGKFAAKVLNLIEEEGMPNDPPKPPIPSDVFFPIFLKTRANIPGIIGLYVKENMKELGWYCAGARLNPLKERAWSSVHSGLIDYLSPTLKTRFFEMPER